MEQAGGGDHEDHQDHQDCQQEGQAGGLEWLRSSCPSLLKALCAVGRPVTFIIYFYCSPVRYCPSETEGRGIKCWFLPCLFFRCSFEAVSSQNPWH